MGRYANILTGGAKSARTVRPVVPPPPSDKEAAAAAAEQARLDKVASDAAETAKRETAAAKQAAVDAEAAEAAYRGFSPRQAVVTPVGEPVEGVPYVPPVPPPPSLPAAEPTVNLAESLETARNKLDRTQGRVAKLQAVADFRRMTTKQSDELQDAQEEMRGAEKDYGAVIDELRRLRELGPPAIEEEVAPPVDRREAPIFPGRQDREQALRRVREAETGVKTTAEGSMGVWDVSAPVGTAPTGEEYEFQPRMTERAKGRARVTAPAVLEAYKKAVEGSPTVRTAMTPQHPVRYPSGKYGMEPGLLEGEFYPGVLPEASTIAGGRAMAPYAPEGTDIQEARLRVHKRMLQLRTYEQRYRKDIPKIKAAMAELERGQTTVTARKAHADKRAELQTLIDEQEKVQAEYDQLKRIRDVTLGVRPLVGGEEELRRLMLGVAG